jgi:hypothetical protein
VNHFSSDPHRRRGRPQKFGRPSTLVPLTLPTDVVRGLRKIDDDLAKAIVRLFETAPAWAHESTVDAELLSIADRHSLIVVNALAIRSLPGIDVIPLAGHRAFLALAPGRGVADLELAVIDRLGDARALIDARERRALEQLRRQLRGWRGDSALRFLTRSIIVVETTGARRVKATARQPVNGQVDVDLVPFADRRSLIVVNSSVVRSLPGVDIIPLSRGRALLALAPGRVVSDLELAVHDRLGDATVARERQALEHLRRQLKTWRGNDVLEFHARAIIVVESLATRSKGPSASARAQTGRSATRRHAPPPARLHR